MLLDIFSSRLIYSQSDTSTTSTMHTTSEFAGYSAQYRHSKDTTRKDMRFFLNLNIYTTQAKPRAP